MHRLSIILTLSLVGCSHRASHSDSSACAPGSLTAPAGFTVVEKSPRGNFIRLSSAERADVSTICSVANSYGGSFDRIDFCTDAAHERGDEYASVIDGQLFDYVDDLVFNLEPVGHE